METVSIDKQNWKQDGIADNWVNHPRMPYCWILKRNTKKNVGREKNNHVPFCQILMTQFFIFIFISSQGTAALNIPRSSVCLCDLMEINTSSTNSIESTQCGRRIWKKPTATDRSVNKFCDRVLRAVQERYTQRESQRERERELC